MNETRSTRWRRRGEVGAVGANLAITIAFALFAVIQLTRTTLAAQQIDDRVEVIKGTVEPIDEDLTNVPKLDETNRIARDILDAARPLSGQAGEILTTARSIDGTVSNILGNASSINGTVRNIRGTVGTLAPVVRSINDGVATINRQGDQVIVLVRDIRLDLANVLAQVGTAGRGGHGAAGGRSIHGHANSNDCAAGGSACER